MRERGRVPRSHPRRPVLHTAYSALAQLARALSAVAPAGEGKIWRSLRARRGIRERFTAWGERTRDAARPLLWMHAPSVGEGLQARPVLQQLRAAHPTLQLAYTHFSPSAARFARTLDVDFTDYLPFDTLGDARVALTALRPRALVFSKLDVWPTLAGEAARRHVGLGLISATLGERSARRSRIAGLLLRDAYARLDAVGAVDEEDADRLTALGVRAAVLTITGDTRYDQVWARAHAAAATRLTTTLRNGRATMVAGSTWPSDERVLLPAWSAVRRARPDARLIIAPHEPSAAHLLAIEQWAAAAGVRLARLDAPAAAIADVVLVDRVGVLGELYELASVAYVGGAFHAAGLHSVIEPAAFGAPVLFGARFQGSRDARLLALAGGGAAVSTAGELAERAMSWLEPGAARNDAGTRAQSVVRAGLGAAARSVALVERLLGLA